jgi:hypothetical protein
MSQGRRHEPVFGPTAIAIHDDGNMQRKDRRGTGSQNVNNFKDQENIT